MGVPAHKDPQFGFFDKASELPNFDGNTYERQHDHVRLGRQFLLVRDLMSDGAWRTLQEIGNETGEQQASISARLRDLRKEKFGGYSVERRRRGRRVRASLNIG